MEGQKKTRGSIVNFDNIKDQVLEKLNEVWSRIKESPYFNALAEKYDNLPSSAQIGLIVGSFVLVIIFLLSIPFSFLGTASDNISDFETDRQMIRELLKASRQAPSSFLSQTKILNFNQLKSQIQTKINNFRLTEEQRGTISELDLKSEGKAFAPDSIIQFGAQADVKSLNVREIKELSYDLQNILPNIKLSGLEVTANAKDDHYFDVIFKFVSFSLSEPEPEDKPKKSKRRSRKRK